MLHKETAHLSLRKQKLEQKLMEDRVKGFQFEFSITPTSVAGATQFEDTPSQDIRVNCEEKLVNEKFLSLSINKLDIVRI